MTIDDCFGINRRKAVQQHSQRTSSFMRSALYYPHTEIVTEKMFKTSLLMWDSVDCIVPGGWYKSKYNAKSGRYKNVKAIQKAARLIVNERSVNEAEKQRVHGIVSDMVNDGVPEAFRYSPQLVDQANRYQVWAEKIDSETWKLLEDSGITSGKLDNGDYPMSRAAGLSIMAIMSDVLAGDSKARITDQGVAYAKLINDSVELTTVSVSASDPYVSIPFKFKTVDLGSVELEKLIELRKCENATDGHEYRRMRHNFCEKIVKHVEAISSPNVLGSDIAEIEQNFVNEMDDEFRELRSRLGKKTRDFWISGELITTIVATGTVLAAASNPNLATSLPLSEVIQEAGSAVAVGGLLRAGYKYFDSRSSILHESPMAYLYQAS